MPSFDLQSLEIGKKIECTTCFMDQIYDGISDCSKKMYSATKFIDYFVHDILDYTILKKEEKNFTKQDTVFDIRDAVSEIIGFQEDKADNKQIKIDAIHLGYPALISENPISQGALSSSSHSSRKLGERDRLNYYVKTDRKRMQQVLLNLLSNALKFTKRHGKILIMTEFIPESLLTGTERRRSQGHIRISVIDSGSGIKQEDFGKLFKLFGSIKNEEQKINQ